MAVDEEKYDDKKALDESSAVNRRLLLSFLLFEVYMLVIVGSTSDMQLLIPDSKVSLPLANFDIPLFGFYIIAPIFMIAFHFNILFNILQHSQKLFSWSEKANSSEKKVLLQPFLFNFLVCFRSGQINYYLLRTILYAIIYFFPLCLLVLTQLKFSKYHSFSMTLWHFVLVLIDVLLLLIYWPRIISQQLSHDNSEKIESLFKDHIRPLLGFSWRCTKKIIAIAISFAIVIVVVLLISLKIRGYSLVSILQFFAVSYLLVLSLNWKRIWAEKLWKNIWLVLWTTILLAPLWKISWNISSFLFKFVKSPKSFIKSFQEKCFFRKFLISVRQKTSIAGIFLIFIVGVSLVNFLVIGSLWVGLFPMNENLYFIYPSLTIVDKTLVAKEPSDTIIRYYLDQKKDKESDWLNFTQGLNLKGRDLRFAQFTRSKLFKANLEEAELQGANLWGAELQGANLRGAKLQGINLCFAELQGANLLGAELRDAVLWSVKLQGANLCFAELQCAELPFAELQGANLQNAKLQGAELQFAKLQGVDLQNAKLQSANLQDAKLQGVDLQKANLQGANLEGAELQGANLREAQLQGAYLGGAHLQGAELQRVKLQGANLEGAKLQGANLLEAQLQGAYLGKAELQGAELGKAQLQGIWGKVDIISSINWEALSETVSNQMEGLKAREATLEQLKKLRERYAKFNISQVLTSNMDLEQFIACRIKCTCISEHVAQGILDQHKRDWFVKELQNQELSLTNEKFSEDIREYMSRTCPEIADKIWKQWYFDSDWWSILLFELGISM